MLFLDTIDSNNKPSTNTDYLFKVLFTGVLQNSHHNPETLQDISTAFGSRT